MPMSITNTAAVGVGQIDIRVGECQIHQLLLDVSDLAAFDDAAGSLPVGLPILANGDPVSAGAQTAFGVIGPEPVQMGAADHFANVIISGALNRDAIEDNLGRVLSADELTAIGNCPQLRLV